MMSFNIVPALNINPLKGRTHVNTDDNRKATFILIVGAVIMAASVAGLIYSGSMVIKDETNKNIAGPNSLPKTGVGPLSMYHVEYGFVFLLIVGFAALLWGYLILNEKRTLQQK